MVGYNPEPINGRDLSSAEYSEAGLASGIATRAIIQPLDVLKIRFQLQEEPIRGQQSGKYKSIRLISQEEGVTAFWKGHVPAQGLSAIYGLVQFASFEWFTKQTSLLLSPPEHLHKVTDFMCGALAGCVAMTAAMPLDVIRTRLVAQGAAQQVSCPPGGANSQAVYRGTLHATVKIYKYEGFAGYFRGWVPSVAQIAPFTGLQFMLYNLFSEWFHMFVDGMDSGGALFSGAMAGTAAKTVLYPLDMVRHRLQMRGFERRGFGKSSNYSIGMLRTFAHVVKHESVYGLFKILSAGVFAIGVSMMMTAISASYEELLLAVFVNGCFQGAGWTPSTLLISAWSSPIEYGMWYSIFGISNTVSGMCLPYALNWPWRSALWYTGVACLVAFFIVLAVLSDDLSTPPNPKKEEEKRDRPSVWQIAQSPAVLHIAFIYCLPISAWFPVELVNANVSVVGYTFFLEAGGYPLGVCSRCTRLVGTLTAGMINDSISRKIGVEKAGRYCAYATTIMMLVAVTVGVHYVLIWPSMIGFLNGCCLHSCILMWSLCSSRIGPSDIQGTAGAVVSLVSQSSSVLAGAPLSWLQGDAGLRALSPLLLGFVLATAATFQLALPISMSETPHKTQ